MATTLATVARTTPAVGATPADGVGPAGWTPAVHLVRGAALPALLEAAALRWDATPHAAAALAWKSYAYRLALPAVVGYATTRRVPLPRPEDVWIRYGPRQPFVTVVLHRPVTLVLPDDPLAGAPGVLVAPDEAAILGQLRAALVDDHLAPLLDRLQQRVHLSGRVFWGSLASGVAQAVIRTPGRREPALTTATALLSALDVADLVDLAELPDGGLQIRRRTCCLAFTLPTPKVCEGCCLRTRD